ncbi:response regulator [Vibrio agarivorans]|uniref:response regulator n=1 Tax=Vibrio agarivorans TaxID=153622 RepID=UPI0022316D1D|nr:response regulator [Vibrio agarivorans]
MQMKSSSLPDGVVLNLGLGLIAIMVLFVDLAIPLGIAAGVPYVTVILVSLLAKSRDTTIIWATVCTVLTLVGYYSSPVGGEVWKVVANRVLAIYAIWAVAIVSLILKQRAEKVAKLESELSIADYRSTLGQVAEYARDAIVITDKAGVVTWVNKGFTHLSGYELSEIQGKKPGDVLQGHETSIAEIKRLSDAIRAGESIKSEIINYHKDGTPYWIDMDIVPVKEHGDVVRFVAVERDVTDRKKLETELQQDTRFALEGSAQRSHLFSLLLHVLAKPLNDLSVLTQNVKSLNDADEIKVTSYQLSGVADALALISDNLHYLSLLDAKKHSIEKLTLEAEPSVKELTNKLLLLAESHSIPFSYSESAALQGLKIAGDLNQTQAGLVFLTLLALSTQKLKSIDLRVNVQAKNEDALVGFELLLADGGETVNLIKEFESSSDDSNTSFRSGLHAGYELIRDMLEADGGRIAIDHDGDVSRLAMFDNYQLIEQSAPDQDTEQKVLIAEDNKVNVIVLTKLLKSLGYESIDVAKDGQEAVAMAESHYYPLILMDNHMPNMTGLDATRIIVQEKKIPSVVIACTADTGSEARSDFFANGATDVIYKPIKKNTLERSISDALSKAEQAVS